MATKNKHIAVYVPYHLLDLLDKYWIDNGLVTKDNKPRHGTAVLSILKEVLLEDREQWIKDYLDKRLEEFVKNITPN